MSSNTEDRDSFGKLVEQAIAEQQSRKLDTVHQRYLGCVGGGLFGFIAAVALFFVFLLLDQTYSSPTDPDFANPIGVILFVFTATATGGTLGVALAPHFARAIKKRRERREK